MTMYPPLRALHAFEAASRHQSFRVAAEELHVTPSAISHQIRLLEEYLGEPLFRRRERRVVLTERGASYAAAVRRGLELILAASEEIRVRGLAGPLTISAAPSIASRWLWRHIAGFYARYPEIELRIRAAARMVDFKSGSVDVAIRHGKTVASDMVGYRLLEERLVALAAPRLLEARTLQRPSDLLQAPLLHGDTGAQEWRTYLEQVLETEPPAMLKGPRFQNAPMAMEAAIAGMGVALADPHLVDSELADGRLRALFAPVVTGNAYFLVHPRSRGEQPQPRVRVFRDWLLALCERG